MIVPEESESFSSEGGFFDGIFTEFDLFSSEIDPGMNALKTIILVEDSDAAGIETGTVISRQKTGKTYAVKDKRRSGIGLTEIVIGEVKETEVGKGRI